MHTNATKEVYKFVICMALTNTRSSGHIVATIAQLKKTGSSFLLLWGKMTLTLLMLRKELNVDGMHHNLKKKEKNNTGATNEKRKRREPI